MSEHSAENDALAALIRTVPIGPFGPNAKALINMGQTTLLTPHEAERLAEVLIGAGWTSPNARVLPSPRPSTEDQGETACHDCGRERNGHAWVGCRDDGCDCQEFAPDPVPPTAGEDRAGVEELAEVLASEPDGTQRDKHVAHLSALLAARVQPALDAWEADRQSLIAMTAQRDAARQLYAEAKSALDAVRVGEE